MSIADTHCRDSFNRRHTVVSSVLHVGFVASVAVAMAWLLQPEPAAGQTESRSGLNPDLQITQFVHDSWTTENGLPQNAVYAALPASDGYLWVGTQDGLVRFDGVRFTVFGKSEGLESTEVRALLEDEDGAIWIGTNGGGVSRLKEGRFTTFRTEDGLSSDIVRSLFQDDQGNIWIGTIDGGVSRYDGTSFTRFTTTDGLAGDVVLSIQQHDGALWFGTQAGLSRFVAGSFSNYSTSDGLPDDLVWSLETDEAGTLWIGTSGGLARARDGEITPYPQGTCGNVVSALHAEPNGVLWFGTLTGGLCRLQNDTFESFSSKHGLTNDRVRAISPDPEGNLWIGTEDGGLNRLRAGKFVHITSAEGLSDDVAFSVMESRDGALWIGTEGAGLNQITAGRIQHLTTANGLPSAHVYALSQDESGSVWIGMYDGGICRLLEDAVTCYGARDGLTNHNVYSILADREGRIWAGTTGGLFVMDDGARFVRYGGDEELAHTPIPAVVQTSEGHVWVGTYGSGLHRIHEHGAEQFDRDDGLSSDVVLVIHEDSRGTMWAGTQSGGLCRIRDEHVACITSKEGLHNDNVLQILEDDHGSLWLGTLQGILRIGLDDLNAVADGRLSAVSPIIFDKSDGLKTAEMSGGTQPAAWKAHDGLLWFATNRGVAYIDPAHIRTNSIPPPVHVESIKIEDDPVSMEGAIVLPAGSRDVTFQYTGLSFTAPREVRFRYMLDGYDDRWIDAGSRREAYYTNLAPGTYTFRVKAANDDGVWNEEGASVSFYLEPFFYQTWWFTWLCIAASLALAVAAYRLRIRRLKDRERELERVVDERTHDLRKEKEITEEAKRVIEGQAEKLRELDRFKTKFFANVSHEFRTPLTMIIGPLENMLAELHGPLPEAMRKQTDVMLRNALRLMRLINQLLDLSKLEDGKMKLRACERNFVAFVEGVVLSCSSFADRKGIDLRFQADSDEIPMTYEPDKLEKVFYNLLSNATKFTSRGGEISVVITQLAASETYPEGALNVEVRDTGKGIPPDELPYIFDRFHQVDGSAGWDHEGTGIGLALAREMILLHGGQISVESEPGTGTAFTITLPKGASHLEPDQIAAGDMADEIAEHGGAMTQLATSDFNFMHDDEQPPTRSANADDDAPLVLVVDDNKDIREYVTDILSDEYRILTACDGAEGLEKARNVLPDLILSDVMMPNVDGNAFCRAVKSSKDLNHIPVILLTARATHQLKIEGLEVGADDYIPKPFNVHELRVRIRNLLRLRHQEKELKVLNEDLEAKVREQLDLMLEERRRYEDDLIDSKERAEASDRLKSNILNNLSHEFRTPLTAILGFTEILHSEAPANLHEFTYEIERGGRRLLRTLDSLLELSRIEADDAGAENERLDMNAVALDVVEGFEAQAAKKGLDFRFAPSDDVNVEVQLNGSAVRQVLQNLVDNAVKFTPEGEVSVRVDRDDDAIHVHVRDTGIGISEKFLPRMYEAFVQESDGYTRNFEGCGLGLTIAKRLTDLIGGTIRVETKRGAGSRFTVSFPAVATPAEA